LLDYTYVVEVATSALTSG